jgi:hypothetical protein
MQSRTAAYILTMIENLEREISFLKALVQQAISEEESDGQGNIIVDATYLEVDHDEILADAVEVDVVEVQHTKPAARTLTLKEQRDEGRKKAQAWARAESLGKAERLAKSKKT